MYIGEASKESGASIKAIRLYEQIGLLPNIARVNSYRVFSEENILLIKFIKIAQTFDFKLNELKQLIYPKDGVISWEKIREIIVIKEQSITEDISRLQNNMKQLNSYNKEIMKCLIENENCFFPQTKI